MYISYIVIADKFIVLQANLVNRNVYSCTTTYIFPQFTLYIQLFNDQEFSFNPTDITKFTFLNFNNNCGY